MKKFLYAFLIGGALLGSSVPAPAQSLSITVYSQNDSKWAKDKMGSTKLTVGNYGCLMTCLASTYRVTPKTLNDWLSKNNGYDAAGNLIHTKAAAYDGSGGVQYVGPGNLPGDASAVGRGIGRGAVYIVRSTRFPGLEHWVLVYTSNGQQSYYMDPWDGTTRRIGDGNVKYGAEARIYSLK